MSSALAMVLVAGMTVPGSGPEKVPGETEQRLDLRWDWRGTWLDSQGKAREVYIRDGIMIARRAGETVWSQSRTFIDLAYVVEQGQSRFRATSLDEQYNYFGIYEQDGDRLTICFRESERPTLFQGGSGQNLLTLHRVRDDGEGKILILHRVKSRK